RPVLFITWSSSSQRISVSIVLGMVLVMVLLLAKQIITLYHAVQKILMKDQHALEIPPNNSCTFPIEKPAVCFLCLSEKLTNLKVP
ncbi:hypothetical protein, partial [Vibrio sp. S12_S33]|uniref:hypothetical protein n=1 Tax=Vibrio sp. S12_S33 TaxID=2720223 RepID=UPI001EE20D9B